MCRWHLAKHCTSLKRIFNGFLLLIVIPDCYASELDKVKNFSREVLEIVRAKEVDRFKNIKVYPDYNAGSHQIIYFFGGEHNKNGKANFLKNSSVLIKYYGPNKIIDSGLNQYSIVYYDNAVISPNENGRFSSVDIENNWGVAYLEALVVVVEGEVMFYRTPFYYGAHAPWVEDYDL